MIRRQVDDKKTYLQGIKKLADDKKTYVRTAQGQSAYSILYRIYRGQKDLCVQGQSAYIAYYIEFTGDKKTS